MNGILRLSRPLAATLFVSCASLAGAAIAGSADAPAQAGATSAKKSAKPRWVEAAAKHSGSGIRLRYAVADAIQPGVATDVRMEFSNVTADDARVELRAPEGATLTDASGAAVTARTLPRGETTTLLLRVTPKADGLQTVDVFTSQAERSSAQSVPLKVGSGKVALKAMGKPQTTPDGEKVISLPAQVR